jgi:hypothetical protein
MDARARRAAVVWCAKRAGARGGAREAHTSSQGDAHGTHDVGGGLTTRRGVTRRHGGGHAQVENRDDMMTTLCRFMSSFGCTE